MNLSAASDELAESKRKIEELAQALEAERERAGAAEAALRNDANSDMPVPGAGNSEKWAGRVVDARMFMSLHPVLTERAAFMRLPSVITWFRAANQLSLLDRAVRPDKKARVSASPLGRRTGSGIAEVGSETQISVKEIRELREHESHVWSRSAFLPFFCTNLGSLEAAQTSASLKPFMCLIFRLYLTYLIAVFLQVLCSASTRTPGCNWLERHNSSIVETRWRMSSCPARPQRVGVQRGVRPNG